MSIESIQSARHKTCTGFTLIEVLVTIIIVSIGLLGLAGLQIGGLRANMSAETRSKATLLASDIIERMRANPIAVEAGVYNINDAETICAGNPPLLLCSSAGNIGGAAAPCTGTEMAVSDTWTWSCGMAAADTQEGGVTNQLPGGTAMITCNDSNPIDISPCSPGSLHTVTVSWSEPDSTDDDIDNAPEPELELQVVL